MYVDNQEIPYDYSMNTHGRHFVDIFERIFLEENVRI